MTNAARPARAGLLAVVVGKDRAFIGDAVDVGCAVSHHAAVVGADVPVADVIRHDDEDVRLLRLCLSGRDCQGYGAKRKEESYAAACRPVGAPLCLVWHE